LVCLGPGPRWLIARNVADASSVLPPLRPRQQAVELDRLANEDGARIVTDGQDRFGVFASLSGVILAQIATGQEPPMPGHSQDVVDRRGLQFPQDSQRNLFWGTVLQLALRIVLTVFVAVTLLCEPPSRHVWICGAVLALYVVIVGCWSAWALRTAARTLVLTRRLVTLLVLASDVAVVSILSVVTGLTSPDDWTSDVMRNGFFLIPLIAAAQLDPVISGVVAIPTLSAFIATCWITQASNHEPWASILLSSAVLAGLAGGSVALSLIQRSKVETISELAQQRTQLLQDLLGVEKHERQTISERLHDGALQCVLVARQDMEDVRNGSTVATDRVDLALVECSQLLRDVVRELHPDVLARLGLKAALTALTDSLVSALNSPWSLTPVHGLKGCGPRRTMCSTARRVRH
jgi:two-component system, NarL family, sensor kinase